MRCPTCGEHLRDHETACPTCGAAVSSRSIVPSVRMGVRSCGRCGYVGGGVGYFKRTGHICLLLGVSAFTWGLGGLAYWIARRKHRICPQCGLGWEHAHVSGPSLAGRATSLVEAGSGPNFGVDDPLPRRGIARRVLGVAMVLLATLMIAVGFTEPELAVVAVGSVMGAGGTVMIWWGLKDRQDRRRALMTRLQRRVLLLATEKRGTLTVTEVAASLNLSLSAAENVLESMDDGLRVRSDVTNQGIIVYEFPEVMHHPRLESGSKG